ncbi:glycosyl transferase, UDP-glucuronosyltransferase [Methylomicrobium album BG8]|uniref:Glycosyl transferase, UDP-glucuronosyltransferase n=1 Tax=Methylomicrobium album BG8 TaxID=686340 RepID=H8GLZ9_METAL|nr:glycosyl transferase, UDP-glucuronosyltransferase [Methylomicrobium album BG8]
MNLQMQYPSGTSGAILAVVCLLPDAGHVLPLLRLARWLSRRGACRVACFLPRRFETAARAFGFDYYDPGGAEFEPDAAVFVRLAGKSIFYNAFSNYYDLSDYYWTPLRAAASQKLAGLAGSLQSLEPRYLLCDNHIFSDYYERLAQACGAALLLNRSEGTLREFRRPFVQAYGIGATSPWQQTLVETAGWGARTFFRYWRAFVHSRRRRRSIALDLATGRLTEAAFKNRPDGGVEPVYLNAGLAVLEPDFASLRRTLPAERELFFPPTVEIGESSLPAGLNEWLDRQSDGRVVYVCFGTMIALSDGILKVLAKGFAATGAPVLWSLPEPQASCLAGYALPARIRIESFVPQAELMASSKVGCFVTHGGAGSLQDAVMAGKPVLCIPFLWDQPYNGALAARLGFGRTVLKCKLTSRRINREIGELLSNPAYREAAARLAQTARDMQRAMLESDPLAKGFPEVPAGENRHLPLQPVIF